MEESAERLAVIELVRFVPAEVDSMAAEEATEKAELAYALNEIHQFEGKKRRLLLQSKHKLMTS